MKKKNFLVCFFSFMLFVLYTHQGFAQQKGDVTLGAQFGRPIGLSMKYFNPSVVSVEFLAAWDLNDFFFFNAHGVFEMDVGGADALNFFYGPGLFWSIKDETNRRTINTEFSAGVSATAGLNYWLNRFELYIRITPRVSIMKATEGNVGGGFGVRYLL